MIYFIVGAVIGYLIGQHRAAKAAAAPAGPQPSLIQEATDLITAAVATIKGWFGK